MAGEVRPLTAKQAALVRVIYRLMLTLRRAPEWLEMMAAAGLRFKNGLQGHINALERKGWLTYAHVGGRRLPGTLCLTGAPMARTPMGLVPVIEPWTSAGRGLLDMLSPRATKAVPA